MLRECLQRDSVRYAQGMATDFTLAADYAWLGKKQDALHYLENAYQKHDPAMCTLLVNVDLLNRHDEPRFKELLKELGLAPAH